MARRIPAATRATVLEHLRQLTGVREIHEGQRLAHDLGLDSLVRVEIQAWIESEFGFPQPEVDAIETVVPGTRKPDPAPAKAFIAECNKRNVILLGAGSFGNCVRFLPALNISDADLDHAFNVFDEAAKVAFA